MRIGIETDILSDRKFFNTNNIVTRCITRHLVYGNNGQQYMDNPSHTWEAFILCIMHAEYDEKKDCMACKMSVADFSVVFSNIFAKSNKAYGLFLEAWAKCGSHDNFHQFYIYDEYTERKTKVIFSISVKGGILEISYDRILTDDIKWLKEILNEQYLKDISRFESLEAMLLYHMLFIELKQIKKIIGHCECYYAELSEKDFLERGISEKDIGWLMESTIDEINELSHIWCVFDEVLDEKPDSDTTNDLCYRLIFGFTDYTKASFEDMSYENQMRAKRECLTGLSLIIGEPIDEDKMINILEAANYNLEMVKAVYESITSIKNNNE